jgi:toxin ParE1/3/4
LKSFRVLPRAVQDLDQIASYIAQDNTDAAVELIDQFTLRFRLLARRLRIGAPRPELAEGLRSSNLGPYLIFYREAGEGIEIVRRLHGRGNVAREFRR